MNADPRRHIPASTAEVTFPPVRPARSRAGSEASRRPRASHTPEPSYTSPGRSGIHHPIIVVLATLVGLIGGGAVASLRAPVWKAQTRLIVGTTVNLTNPSATPGLATAETQIAANYSRLVGTANVSDGIKRRIGHYRGSLTASPVPQSAIILLDASASSQTAASALAGAGQGALVDAVNAVNQQTAAANAALLNQYTTASEQLAKDTVALGNLTQSQTLLQTEINGLQSSINSLALATQTSSTAEKQQSFQSRITADDQQLASLTTQLVTLNAAVNVDKLKALTIQNQYQASYNPNLVAEEAVAPLGSAIPEGSNRTSNLEIGLLAGLVGGLVAGLILASLVDVRIGRRLERASAPPT